MIWTVSSAISAMWVIGWVGVRQHFWLFLLFFGFEAIDLFRHWKVIGLPFCRCSAAKRYFSLSSSNSYSFLRYSMKADSKLWGRALPAFVSSGNPWNAYVTCLIENLFQFNHLKCTISFLPAKVVLCLDGLCKAGAPLGFAEKIILAMLRYFFAKPCTIRAQDGLAGKKRK